MRNIFIDKKRQINFCNKLLKRFFILYNFLKQFKDLLFTITCILLSTTYLRIWRFYLQHFYTCPFCKQTGVGAETPFLNSSLKFPGNFYGYYLNAGDNITGRMYWQDGESDLDIFVYQKDQDLINSRKYLYQFDQYRNISQSFNFIANESFIHYFQIRPYSVPRKYVLYKFQITILSPITNISVTKQQDSVFVGISDYRKYYAGIQFNMPSQYISIRYTLQSNIQIYAFLYDFLGNAYKLTMDNQFAFPSQNTSQNCFILFQHHLTRTTSLYNFTYQIYRSKATENNSTNGRINVLVIILGVIGGLLFMILICVLIYLCRGRINSDNSIIKVIKKQDLYVKKLNLKSVMFLKYNRLY